jgi:hypothetical protein
MNTFLPKVFGAVAMATALLSSPSLAQTSKTNEPWCGTDRDGAMNCLYRTQSECESVVRSEGGECVPNPGTTIVFPEELDD